MWYFSWVQPIAAIVFFFFLIFKNLSVVVFIAMTLFLSFLK